MGPLKQYFCCLSLPRLSLFHSVPVSTLVACTFVVAAWTGAAATLLGHRFSGLHRSEAETEVLGWDLRDRQADGRTGERRGGEGGGEGVQLVNGRRDLERWERKMSWEGGGGAAGGEGLR